MHGWQSYSVSLCTCFGAKTLHNIDNFGLCIRVHVYNTRFVFCRELAPGTISLTIGSTRGDDSKRYGYYTLSIRLDMTHCMRKSVFGVKDQVRHKMGYTTIEAS